MLSLFRFFNENCGTSLLCHTIQDMSHHIVLWIISNFYAMDNYALVNCLHIPKLVGITEKYQNDL